MNAVLFVYFQRLEVFVQLIHFLGYLQLPFRVIILHTFHLSILCPNFGQLNTRQAPVFVDLLLMKLFESLSSFKF